MVRGQVVMCTATTHTVVKETATEAWQATSLPLSLSLLLPQSSQVRYLAAEGGIACKIVDSTFRSFVERELLIGNQLARIHFIIEVIWWTGLAPWEFQFPFPGSLTSTSLACSQVPDRARDPPGCPRR